MAVPTDLGPFRHLVDFVAGEPVILLAYAHAAGESAAELMNRSYIHITVPPSEPVGPTDGLNGPFTPWAVPASAASASELHAFTVAQSIQHNIGSDGRRTFWVRVYAIPLKALRLLLEEQREPEQPLPRIKGDLYATGGYWIGIGQHRRYNGVTSSRLFYRGNPTRGGNARIMEIGQTFVDDVGSHRSFWPDAVHDAPREFSSADALYDFYRDQIAPEEWSGLPINEWEHSPPLPSGESRQYLMSFFIDLETLEPSLD